MDLVNRFDIFFIDLNPSIGREINKVRPCVVISPNEMNNVLSTVIIAPLTSTIKKYPMRVNCIVQERHGQIALDHLRFIDKIRLKKKVAHLDMPTQRNLINTLLVMFS